MDKTETALEEIIREIWATKTQTPSVMLNKYSFAIPSKPDKAEQEG